MVNLVSAKQNFGGKMCSAYLMHSEQKQVYIARVDGNWRRYRGRDAMPNADASHLLYSTHYESLIAAKHAM